MKFEKIKEEDVICPYCNKVLGQGSFIGDSFSFFSEEKEVYNFTCKVETKYDDDPSLYNLQLGYITIKSLKFRCHSCGKLFIIKDEGVKN